MNLIFLRNLPSRIEGPCNEPWSGGQLDGKCLCLRHLPRRRQHLLVACRLLLLLHHVHPLLSLRIHLGAGNEEQDPRGDIKRFKKGEQTEMVLQVPQDPPYQGKATDTQAICQAGRGGHG